MARTQKINENFSLSFNSREDQTGDTVADIDVRFDNPKDESGAGGGMPGGDMGGMGGMGGMGM